MDDEPSNGMEGSCVRRSQTCAAIHDRRKKAELQELRFMADDSTQLLPPAAYPDNPATCLPTKHIHASLNKIKHPINVVKVRQGILSTLEVVMLTG